MDDGQSQSVTNYRYNGLGMRIMWQSDLDAGGTLEDSERTYAAYDSRWRVVATFADDAGAPAEAFVHHAAGLGAGGGSSYIDSVILRDRDADTDESHTLEERRYFCQNWRADVVAATKADGTPLEYVRYSAYGEPTVYPVADINMDGVVNAADYAIWVNIVAGGAAGAEVVGADLNFDGTADAAESDGYDFYESYDANAGLSGKNHVSSPSVANRLGYAGYEWDDVLKADHVRYRVYFPDIGRWSRRDPVGYSSRQMSLYEYVADSPVHAVDSRGLWVVPVAQVVADPPAPVIEPEIEPIEDFPDWWSEPENQPFEIIPTGRIGALGLYVCWGICWYQVGAACSSLLIADIEEAPDTPRPTRIRPQRQRPTDDCRKEERAKDAACGAPPKKGKPPVLAPPQGVPGQSEAGGTGSRTWCETFLNRIENRRNCLMRRIQYTWCMTRVHGGDDSGYDHPGEIEAIRKSLDRMRRIFRQECSKYKDLLSQMR